MARRLKLTRYAVENIDFRFVGAYRLRVVAEDAENTGADPNVFLFLRRPAEPAAGVVLDDFHAVASPADVAEYPPAEPNDVTTYPFFRYHTVTLDFRNTALADEVWTTIVREVGVLLRALDRLDQLSVVGEVTVGQADEASSASSLSTGG